MVKTVNSVIVLTHVFFLKWQNIFVCVWRQIHVSICVCVYIYWSQIGQWFKCLPYFLTRTLKRDTCRAGGSLECLELCPFHLTQMPRTWPCSRILLRCPWSCSMESQNHLYFAKLLCRRRKLSFLTLKVEIPPEQWSSFHSCYSMIAASDDQLASS